MWVCVFEVWTVGICVPWSVLCGLSVMWLDLTVAVAWRVTVTVAWRVTVTVAKIILCRPDCNAILTYSSFFRLHSEKQGWMKFSLEMHRTCTQAADFARGK